MTSDRDRRDHVDDMGVRSETGDWAPRENVYGHRKRLEWIASQLSPGQRAVELGCGTGVMITAPLRRAGFDVIGVDLDEPSVAYGRDLLRREGQDPDVLLIADIRQLPLRPKVIIASEVLEHLVDRDLDDALEVMRASLNVGGQLLVTVPNGYGWFELESLLWFKWGFGRLVQRLKLDRIVLNIKCRFLGLRTDVEPPSTLADSPHVQRFTRRSLCSVLRSHGFEIQSVEGTVLFAGPFTNLLFDQMVPFITLNRCAGSLCPALASGWLLAAVRVS